MALTLGDNFSYGGSKPLDARLTYSTLAEMKAVADSTMYNGCLAYCVATDKTYQWKLSNTVDPDTGRWREFSAEVDDAIDDTSENPVKNAVIAEALDGKQDKLTAGTNIAISNDNIISTTSTYTMRYSTQEQVVGIWYDGKTLYQRTICINNPTFDDVNKQFYVYFSNVQIDTPVAVNAYYAGTDGVLRTLEKYGKISGFGLQRNTSPVPNSFYIQSTESGTFSITIFVTIQYTKTTD